MHFPFIEGGRTESKETTIKKCLKAASIVFVDFFVSIKSNFLNLVDSLTFC